MLVADVPNLPDAYLPIVVAESRAVADAGNLKIGVCQPIPNVEGMNLNEIGGEHALNPVGELVNYLWASTNRFRSQGEPGRDLLTTWEQSAAVTLLQPPKLGRLVKTTELFPKASENRFFYQPKPGDMSRDQVVFLVKMGDYEAKVYINLYPVDGATGPYWDKKICGKRGLIYRIGSDKQSGLASEAGILLNRAFADRSSAANGLSVADLPGTAVAQTTGEGADATITLDTTAAGHNWFIDATPADNAEYLPTSNPNQWIAKDGSEAANKMDLLSVLLHEYGHALGIEHSPDGNDFMAATLQPGVRRLPSTEELALMAQLAGQARLALDGSDVPDAPDPALPLTALGFALFGRIRRTDYGAWTMETQSASLLPQYQIAINPTLSPLPNPLPLAGEGANGAAFGSGTGPSDAFEVALLNANTGEALTGTDGLSQSDAGTNQRGQLLH